jgi:Ca2+-binding RTX toxin-like protein
MVTGRPNNDNFEYRRRLLGFSTTDTGSNVGFTGEPGEPNHAGVNFGVSAWVNSGWWTWTAPASGLVTLNTIGSNYDTSLAVYTGSAVNALSPVAGNDDFFGLQSRVQFNAVAGQTYQIAVDGYTSATGNINLNLNLPLNFTQTGNAGNNNLNGTGANDVIGGLAGNDAINSNGGNDALLGGDGNDTINGGSGIDYIDGGNGNDIINGNGGNDVLVGGNGNDTIAAAGGNDYIDAGAGNDRIYGNGGNDTLIGGFGDDAIYGASGNDLIVGDLGNDTIYGNGGNDSIVGAAGDDLIYGGSQADTIYSGTGNDTIYGNGGGDFINTGAGFDTVWLGSGAARVVLEINAGFDTIKNFQLGQTLFQLGSGLNKSQLSFTDSADGVRISASGDLLAVVSWNQASTFEASRNSIFI